MAKSDRLSETYLLMNSFFVRPGLLLKQRLFLTETVAAK
jgi:hypothetical protein